MTSNLPDSDLRELLTDAVSDIEPAHRLSEIQAQTARPERRAHWYVAGGTMLATAAAVTTFAVVIDLDGGSTAPDPAPDPTEAVETRAVAAYYIGKTPLGRRLYREFANVEATVPRLEAALDLIERGSSDPDYTTAWGPASFADASVQGNVIYVDLADESLHDRPSGMSQPEAALALQQVIYTVQGAVGRGRLPVQFRLNGNPTNQTLGEETANPLVESPQLDVLALASITEPAEGATVSGSFIAEGVASSFKAMVAWQIIDNNGFTLLHGYATAEGDEGRLWAWRTEVDLGDLFPGTYTFVADATVMAANEGSSNTFVSDTRTIVVE